MNYELAKKLKDTGFPQKGNGLPVFAFKLDKSKSESEIRDQIEEINNTAVYAPTLSELIEACGSEKVFSLYNGNKRWEASKIGDEGDAVHQFGSTPEEAVANLWLELNKKI